MSVDYGVSMTRDGTLGGADRREQARELFALLSEGEFERVRSRFAPSLQQMLPPGQLKSAWNDQTAGATTVLDISTNRETVVVEFRTGESRRQLTVSFTDDGRLEAILLDDPDGVTPEPYEQPRYVDESVQSRDRLFRTDDREVTAEVVTPDGSGPFPGVVIVPGSGVTDMDGYTGDGRPYRDLAYGLASNGYATVRYDKRPVSGDETADERLIADAARIVDQFCGSTVVAQRRVTLCGHSLGGFILPSVAAECGLDTGIVVAAPCGDLLTAAATQLGIDASGDRLRAQMDEDTTLFGFPASFWREASDRRPAETASSLGLSLFVCHADDDEKVHESSYQRWCDTLGDAATGSRYAGLSHTFLARDGPDAGHVPRRVLRDIVAWLDETISDE